MCSEAIIKILQHNSNCNVLHIYNPNLLAISLLLSTLKKLNYKLIPASDKEMSNIISNIIINDSKNDILSGIIHDLDSDKNLIYTTNVRVEYQLSELYLKNIGFLWKNIDETYIIKYMNYFKKIGFIK